VTAQLDTEALEAAMNCPRCRYTEVLSGQTPCGNCGAVRTYDRNGLPVPFAPTRPPTQLGGLSTATSVGLVLVGLCYLTVAVADGLSSVGFALTALTVISSVVVIPLFLTFYLVRRNAGEWGPQRRA
jgi:hypothetical protein